MVKLFVGGFSLNITEIELVMQFAIYGDVSTIKIVRDKKTGKCKGYAFIEMVDMDAAKRAVDALDGAYMGNKLLKVNISEDKPVAPKRAPSKFYSKPPSRY